MVPYSAVELDAATGNCISVMGPAPMTAEIPPPEVPAERYTKVAEYGYEGGDTSRLAVYLYRTSSKWLALAHSLKTMGIPFFITTSLARALEFDTVLVYPFAPPLEKEAAMLNDHMAAGNTVIFGMLTSPLYMPQCSPSTFSAEASKEMSYLSFIPDGSSAEETESPTQDPTESCTHRRPIRPTSYFTEETEQNLKIWKDWPNEGWSVYNYHIDPTAIVLAHYKKRTDNGDEAQPGAAVFSKTNEMAGQCVALGMNLGGLSSASHTNKMAGTGRTYSSNYDPGQVLAH